MNFGTLTILLLEEKSKPRKNKSNGTKQGIAKAYDNLVDKIEEQYKDNEPVTIDKINAIDATEHMKKKMIIWFKRDKKPHLSKAKKLENELINIMGIGKTKATSLINAGLKNINQLHMDKWKSKLHASTRAYLEMKPLQSIPRQIIEQFESYLSGFTEYKWYIAGSYRRGKESSSDIDILLIDKDADDATSFAKLMEYINKSYHTFGYSKGSKKLSMLIKLSDAYVKADVFVCKPESEFTFLVYLTGSKDFNVTMRSALKKGITKNGVLHKYKLDQYHLWEGNETIPIPNERALFDIAGMQYLEPHERN